MIAVSNDTLKRWEKAGKITALRTPTGHRRFRVGDVLALLESNTPKEGAA